MEPNETDTNIDTSTPEVGETASVVEAPAAEISPVSEPEAAPAPEAPPNPATEVETEPAGEAEVAEPAEVAVETEVEPWVGEISKLNDLGWFKELPPQQRKSLSEGLSTVRKNMDRAFHQKSAEIKAQREALDSREKLILGIARGDIDADQTIEEAVEAKLADRLTALTAELTELKENRADPAEIAEVRAAKEALQATLDEIQATYQKTAEELEAYREVVRKVEAEKSRAETDRVMDFLEKNAPDLMENEAAFSRFMASEDFDEGDFDLALKYARLKYPAPPKPAAATKKEAKPAEKVPDALDMMGKGAPANEAGAGGKTIHKRYNPIDDVDAEIRRERIARGG